MLTTLVMHKSSWRTLRHHNTHMFHGFFNESKKHNIGIEFENLKHNMPRPSLTFANFDGASAIHDRRGGVLAHILQEMPGTIRMHCIAHNFELAVLDCKYKETIKGFSFFTVLPPKRMR